MAENDHTKFRLRYFLLSVLIVCIAYKMLNLRVGTSAESHKSPKQVLTESGFVVEKIQTNVRLSAFERTLDSTLKQLAADEKTRSRVVSNSKFEKLSELKIIFSAPDPAYVNSIRGIVAEAQEGLGPSELTTSIANKLRMLNDFLEFKSDIVGHENYTTRVLQVVIPAKEAIPASYSLNQGNRIEWYVDPKSGIGGLVTDGDSKLCSLTETQATDRYGHLFRVTEDEK